MSTAAVTDPVAAPAPAPARRRLDDARVQAGLVTVAVLAVYLLTAAADNPYNHWVLLADALLHGRLHLVDAPAYLELARYDGAGAACTDGPECRGYVVEPPVPALLLVPLVALFGTGLDLVPVSAVVGAAAMGLFWLGAHRLGWELRRRVALTVLLSFGTNFWWAAGDGAVWTFAHVCAVLFLMAAFALAAGGRRVALVGLLLGLAGLCRLPVFLAFPFFLYLATRDDAGGWRVFRGRVVRFGAALGAAALVVPLYNLARYGSVLDAGYAHPQYQDVAAFADGRFSVTHIPRQLYAMFVSAPQLVEDRFPFFVPSPLGMALVLVTPAVLYAVLARRGALEIAAAVALGLVAIPHLLYAATGYGQFGYRFSLDYLPMLAVLVASGIGARVGVRAWLLIGVSVLVAMWGPLYFFDTPVEGFLGITLRWD